jgi:hypothetical protein
MKWSSTSRGHILGTIRSALGGRAAGPDQGRGSTSRTRAAAAAIVITVAHGSAVGAQDETADLAALCEAGSKGARLELTTEGFMISADSLVLRIGDLIFTGSIGQAAASSGRGPGERILETRWFEHGFEQGLQFVFLVDGDDWRVSEILTRNTAEGASWISFVATEIEEQFGVEYSSDVFNVSAPEPHDAELWMCGLRVFAEAEGPTSSLSPEDARAAIAGVTDPRRVHEALVSRGYRKCPSRH